MPQVKAGERVRYAAARGASLMHYEAFKALTDTMTEREQELLAVLMDYGPGARVGFLGYEGGRMLLAVREYVHEDRLLARKRRAKARR